MLHLDLFTTGYSIFNRFYEWTLPHPSGFLQSYCLRLDHRASEIAAGEDGAV